MRKVSLHRKTKETDISIDLNLDGSGDHSIDTSIPFLDHMLSLFSFHGSFDLRIKATGDINIDYHHLMEDLGITLGEAVKKALGDKKGINRYAEATIPMDESLAQVVIDISGRPYLVYRVSAAKKNLRGLEMSLFEDFFRAFSNHSLINIHINLRYGRDIHHIFESIFKAFGRALSNAVRVNPKRFDIPSTKGSL
ncbi:MAG: imidazoleglycerol-phosphate dehydratase HisB [Thermodesulfovibrionales bacterium]|nr:imidazoleglycerol-phosphate dehydratase HisB [Thermodesulfovibrionales bacterium]